MTKAERLERDIIRLSGMKAHEDDLRGQGYRYIAGIDEVGRGPLAGPVYAACVVLPPDWDVPGVNDSKKLSAKKREELDSIIRERAVAYGIGIADNIEIDDINILEATKKAMLRAVHSCNDALRLKYDCGIDMLLVDAVKLDAGIPCESMIKGDEKSLSIAAASIVAKVARDKYMTELDAIYPGYDFAGNKGYGTAKHYEGLKSLGYTPVHRRSFLKKFEAETGACDSRLESVKCDASGEAEVSMAGKKGKVYAVKAGRRAGIYQSWDECRKQVDGYPGAAYKSFGNINDACDYLGIETPQDAVQNKPASVGIEMFPEGVRAYVDGSYDAVTGRFSCGVVMIRTDADGSVKTRELSRAFDDPVMARQRNVAGELMGAKMAIDFCLENGIEAVEIYHDYEGIGRWADRLWKANNPVTQGYREYVERARTRMRISFVKVPAHSGVRYNELADKLAKEALK